MLNMSQCRACLDLGGEELIPFNVQSIFQFNLLTSLNINLLDNLPQQLCESCYNVVNLFIEFREKCIVSDSVLKNVKEEQKIEINQNEEEFKDIDLKVEYEAPSEDKTLLFFEDHESSEFITYAYEDDNCGDDYDLNIKPIKQTERTLRKKREAKKLPPESSDQIVVGGQKLTTQRKPKKTPGEVFECGLCKNHFESLQSLSEHLQTHENDKSCLTCFEQFEVWPQLVLHRLKHLTKKYVSCHICHHRYKEADHLKYHYIRNHYSDESLLLKCTDCAKAFKSAKRLRCHEWFNHSSRSYICDFCNQNYANKQTLIGHISRRHLRNRKHSCNQCDYSSYYATNLRDHKVRRHAPSKVICQNCARVFPGQAECDNHNCTKKLVVCPICGKVLKTVKYNAHMATHDKVGRYKCDRCPAVYKSSTGLQAHVNNHDGIRNKHCEYCSASFNQTSALIKHRRIHTGEKPYVCKICSKGFTANHNLKVHMRVHGEDLIVKRVPKEDNNVKSKFYA